MEKIRRTELMDMVGEPLLQAGELEKAKNIARPNRIPVEQLELWYEYAKSVADKQGFQAVAFTEFKPHIRELLGFDRKVQPRVMFYRHPDLEPEGSLVINPVLEVDDDFGGLRVENGC
jgi:hypothetical protein